MLYLLYKIGEYLVLSLPLKISYRLAQASGNLYYLLARKDRKIVFNNNEVILKQTGNTSSLHYINRMVFVNFARYLVEFFRTPRIDLKYIEKNIKIEGRKNLDNALSLGKGVLLLSAHLGNWEFGAMVLAMLGYPINIVAWTHKNKLINDFFVQRRQSKAVKVIPLGTAIRGVFSALKKNEGVGLLGDIEYINPEMGIKVKLFGRDTIMPKGPAEFSLKTGAAVVPVFALREKNNALRIVLEEPIIYNYSANENEEDVLARLTQRMAKTIESYIGLYPEQWFMFRPRWQSDT